MLDRLRLQMLNAFCAIVERCRSAMDTLVLRWLSLARPDAESSILQLLYVLKEVYRPLALVERPSDGLKRPVGQRYSN